MFMSEGSMQKGGIIDDQSLSVSLSGEMNLVHSVVF